jgi:hypothetical protein
MLYRNCEKCARITKHDYNTKLCLAYDKEQEIEDALESYRQDSKDGATW